MVRLIKFTCHIGTLESQTFIFSSCLRKAKKNMAAIGSAGLSLNKTPGWTRFVGPLPPPL